MGLGLATVIALGGCAGASTSASDIAKIPLKSPAIAGGSIPALYTCAGKNIAPPLEWGAVPAGTAELALFVLGFTPAGPNNRYTASVDWAVAGLSPSLHNLRAGTLPAKANIGRDSDGKRHYSVCPKKGSTEQYQFELYALSPEESIRTGFTGLPVVAALSNSKPSHPTMGHGGFAVAFKRT
jgi:hypothetical protein